MYVINQKEYLKKYLGKVPGEKKKKKKKIKPEQTRLHIIDDDEFSSINTQDIQKDIEAENEDAPQIVAVIDDRPPSLRIDEKTNSKLWQPIGEPIKIEDTSQDNQETKYKIEFKTKSIKAASKDAPRELSSGKSKRKDNSPLREIKIEPGLSPVQVLSETDNSPVRRRRRDSDESPVRKKRRDSDESPVRRRGSPKRQRARSPDNSPPRQHSSTSRTKYKDFSPIREIKIEPASPTERDNPPPDADMSPPRRRPRRDSDSSPVRIRGKESRHRSPLNRNVRDSDISPPRRRPRRDSDTSPVRKRNRSLDNSPSRKTSYNSSGKYRKTEDRSRNKDRRADISPPRRKVKEEEKTSSRRSVDRTEDNKRARNASPPRKKSVDITTEKKKNEESTSKSNTTNPKEKSRWGSKEDVSQESVYKMTKTLDGKSAGLQNAVQLARETLEMKRREEEMFKKMAAEVSGVNAQTIVRGKKRDYEAEAEAKLREQETKAKYDKWGKGLKQVESLNDKIAEDMYEMSKPLARYADDEDLENYLKSQEREGDPMLAYIRKKKKKEAADAGVSEKPRYQGEFMPNRFGIPPGYRWDGVDRSNGYEKRWFEIQNSKKAQQDESYKWSTEDM